MHRLHAIPSRWKGARAAACGLLLAFGAAGAASSATAMAPGVATTADGGVQVTRDVPYQVIAGFHPLTADVYVPAGAGPFPAVIFAHGGGWGVGGPRMEDVPDMMAGLARRGIVAMAINYRFHGEAKFPAQIQDAKAAIRWLRSNAAAYRVDGAHVGIWGASAGGYLAALAGVTCGVMALEPVAPPPGRAGGPPGMATATSDPAQSDCVQAVVDWYGPNDFASMDGQALPKSMAHAAPTSAESQLLGCTLPQCPAERLKQASVLTYVDRNDTAPVLIMHGDSDHAVPPGQSAAFDAALKAAGVSSTLVVVPGADHGFAGITAEQRQRIHTQVYDFFAQTLAQTLARQER